MAVDCSPLAAHRTCKKKKKKKRKKERKKKRPSSRSEGKKRRKKRAGLGDGVGGGEDEGPEMQQRPGKCGWWAADERGRVPGESGEGPT